MVIFIDKKATPEQILTMSAEYQGYIKIVIDIEKEVIAGGAERHVDGEKFLLEKGSKQENLWGGGIDWETKEIDYNSMINLRPTQGNPSRDILSQQVRDKFDAVARKLLLR